MANLIIQENGVARTRPAVTGEEITIKTPCGCSDVTGVQIAGVAYPFYDASGNSLADMTGLFAKDSLIRVLIDADKTRAYILNADTNAYLEGKFNRKADLQNGKVPANQLPEMNYDPKGSADSALSSAKSYTDQKIAAIPTPDVSGQIGTHNNDSSAHADIREALANASAVKVYNATIGTSWTANPSTGVRSQNVAISGVLAKHTAKVDHRYAGDGSSGGYKQFVQEENQYLSYITNGYAETYDGGITFYIFGDPPTMTIPIVVEVA